jgi:ABC-type Fe3+/spermidine/putrescine transport system ATPase subunit
MLELKKISAKLDDFQIQNISLKIEKGDYFILLGPSGSGKSVLLELIAGFYKLKSGNIFFNENDISEFRIQDRKIGFLYQDFAVFPHLTVEQNIAFPLKLKKVQKKIIETEVFEISRQLEIEHLLKRTTTGLSGGELQRIALARTLITRPEILLLDEPLSSLDIQLHKNILLLLKKINKNGQTIIHVTHNYSEALALANKIAIISDGKIIQHGTINEVFENPANKFVANFMGINNYFSGEVFENHNKKYLEIENKIEIEISSNKINLGKCNLIIDDEKIKIHRNFSDEINCIEGTIIEILRISNGYEIVVDVGFIIFVQISNDEFVMNNYHVNDIVNLTVNEGIVRFF